MFSEKHVRLFSETRTRIYENTYVFFQKDDGDIQAIRILYTLIPQHYYKIFFLST